MVGLEGNKLESFQSKVDGSMRNLTKSIVAIVKNINSFIASENEKCNDSSMPRAKRNLILSINLELFDKLRKISEEIQFSKENGQVILVLIHVEQ